MLTVVFVGAPFVLTFLLEACDDIFHGESETLLKYLDASRSMAPSTDIQAVIATSGAKLETKMNDNLVLIVNRIPAAESTIVRRLDSNHKEIADGFCPTEDTFQRLTE
ncbi:hypothetical protein K3495_g7969 [Podosphaera aphanis]|nr:hypothetical protein K3495_g7969 [Podosphaera aphanis]